MRLLHDHLNVILSEFLNMGMHRVNSPLLNISADLPCLLSHHLDFSDLWVKNNNIFARSFDNNFRSYNIFLLHAELSHCLLDSARIHAREHDLHRSAEHMQPNDDQYHNNRYQDDMSWRNLYLAFVVVKIAC